VSSKAVMDASQTVVVNQSQNIVFKNSTFDQCGVSIKQQANVVAKQTAVFKAMFASPREIIKKLTQGPNSILGQAMASRSPVMQQFLSDASKSLGTNTSAELSQKLTNILKVNINQSSIMRATQNTFINQEQNVLFENFQCKGGDKAADDKAKKDIDIVQQANVNAVQNAFFTLIGDAFGSDPAMRQAIRRFNGDYDKNVLDAEVEKGVSIPDVCMNDKAPATKEIPCPPCSDCPSCPVCKCSKKCPECSDFVLRANLLYTILGISFLLMLLIIVLKK
jgi:hypothetical protein